MSDRDKDAEILALRHQITVLERQLGSDRVRFTPSDRAFLAALLHRMPFPALRRVRLLVRPDTVLRWHRERPTATPTAHTNRRPGQAQPPRHTTPRPPWRHPPRIQTCRITCTAEVFGKRRVDTGGGQDLPNRGGTDPVAQPGELPLDPAAPPARVL